MYTECLHLFFAHNWQFTFWTWYDLSHSINTFIHWKWPEIKAMVTAVCICQCPCLLVCHAWFFTAGKCLSLQITEVFDGTSGYNHCSCGWQLQSNSLHADLGSKSSWSLHTTHTYVHLITFSWKTIKKKVRKGPAGYCVSLRGQCLSFTNVGQSSQSRSHV